jgi:nicotinamidase-related amidase
LPASVAATIECVTTALLVIDVQESFRQRENWADISAPDIADRIARLVEHARGQGDHVVWVLHTEPGTGTVFDPDRGHVRLLPGLEPKGDEPVLCKTSHNAFTTTNLAQALTSRGVSEVVVTGIRTEQCCETTARVASDLGYTVRFVLDATATQPLPRFDGTGTYSAAEVQDRTASALAGRFAEITTIAEILATTPPRVGP